MDIIINKIEKGKPNTVEWVNSIDKKKLTRYLERSLEADDVVLAKAEPINRFTIEEKPMAKEYTTLSEWLDTYLSNHPEYRQIKGNKSRLHSILHKMANIVPKAYAAKYGVKPEKITRPDDRGRWLKRAYGYMPKHFTLLERAFEISVREVILPKC